MKLSGKKDTMVLFLGDIVLFYVTLWLALLIRYSSLPSWDILSIHLLPFSVVFVVWLVVFLIAGLYEKHTVFLKRKLPSIILNAVLVNILIAISFFYFIPAFGITPKTNLFIYLIVYLALILLWRLYGFEMFRSGAKQNAILVGYGEEIDELLDEINNNNRYNLRFVSSIDLDSFDSHDFYSKILNRIYTDNISVVAIDLHNPKVDPLLPHFYNLIFSNIIFLDTHNVYEDLFGRIPLSLVQHSWFLENISLAPKIFYDLFKRTMDWIISFFLFFLSLIVYPFIALAIKIEDGGSVFYTNTVVGQNGKNFKIIKFRSMSVNKKDGVWIGEDSVSRVTKVGEIIRKTRIDELPQLINVIKGDLSLIGPRPELPALVKEYEESVPYYNIRHLIKPGLSGWAQINQHKVPHHGVGVEETKVKLSYDLFYIKNRSIFLDVKIALRTIQTILSRSGI
jgi:exopolysaccharide biosynthesis polyprenyl glycosylphosphotransferase